MSSIQPYVEWLPCLELPGVRMYACWFIFCYVAASHSRYDFCHQEQRSRIISAWLTLKTENAEHFSDFTFQLKMSCLNPGFLKVALWIHWKRRNVITASSLLGYDATSLEHLDLGLFWHSSPADVLELCWVGWGLSAIQLWAIQGVAPNSLLWV